MIQRDLDAHRVGALHFFEHGAGDSGDLLARHASIAQPRRHFELADELRRAVNAAMDSGKPTLVNTVIDPAAGSESGRIGNLNPQSKLGKKK